MVKHFEDLLAWQKSIELAKEVFLLTRKFPDDQRYGLTSQVQRSAVSVSSNIAEGHGRGTQANFSNFLSIARGSLMEVRSQLHLAVALGFVSKEECSRAMKLSHEVGRLTFRLLDSVQNSD